MQPGKFELVDSKSNEMLINNNDVQNVEVIPNESDNNILLKIIFNSDGIKKFKALQEKYNNIDNQFTLQIDDEALMTTHINDNNDFLYLSVGEFTESTLVSAKDLAAIIATNPLPISYQITDVYNDDTWSDNSDAIVKEIKVNGENAKEGQQVLNLNSSNPDNLQIFAKFENANMTEESTTKTKKSENNNIEGTYFCENYNGKEATLVINKDGTIYKYTDNINNKKDGKWRIEDNKLYVYFEYTTYTTIYTVDRYGKSSHKEPSGTETKEYIFRIENDGLVINYDTLFKKIS